MIRIWFELDWEHRPQMEEIICLRILLSLYQNFSGEKKNAQDAQETNQHSYPGTPWISIATVCLQGMLNWLHHNTGYNTEQNISPRASQRDDINPRFADCIANSCICFLSQTKSLANSIRSRIPFYGRLFLFSHWYLKGCSDVSACATSMASVS
jgi:hypothetical protein